MWESSQGQALVVLLYKQSPHPTANWFPTLLAPLLVLLARCPRASFNTADRDKQRGVILNFVKELDVFAMKYRYYIMANNQLDLLV